jgi:hypothetical protein
MSAIAPIATKMLHRDERRKGPTGDQWNNTWFGTGSAQCPWFERERLNGQHHLKSCYPFKRTQDSTSDGGGGALSDLANVAFSTLDTTANCGKDNILGMSADQVVERRNGRSRITLCTLQNIAKPIRVASSRMIFFERLENLSRAAFSAQVYFAERPGFHIGDGVSCRFRYQYRGSEHFVGSLKPRCRIDGVAVRRVVEPRRAAEVSDDGAARVDADAGHPESQLLRAYSTTNSLENLRISNAAARAWRAWLGWASGALNIT